MAETRLTTDHLMLVLQTRQQTLAIVEAMDPADRAEVSPVWLERIRTSSEADPWLHGFRMLERSSRQAVGFCGYKGPPDTASVVEISYGVAPEHQGRGYATEAARALADYAFASGQVRVVCAHTLPQESASTSVLTKCGFTRVGEVIDPEDGLVWRWERRAPLGAE